MPFPPPPTTGLAAAQPGPNNGETTTEARTSGRPVPRGPAAGPNYVPTPEEAAAMAAAEAIRCGVCQFWSPTANGCVSVPLKYECAGEVGSKGLMGCGVECAYYEEDGEHGKRREAGEREKRKRTRPPTHSLTPSLALSPSLSPSPQATASTSTGTGAPPSPPTSTPRISPPWSPGGMRARSRRASCGCCPPCPPSSRPRRRRRRSRRSRPSPELKGGCNEQGHGDVSAPVRGPPPSAPWVGVAFFSFFCFSRPRE